MKYTITDDVDDCFRGEYVSAHLLREAVGIQGRMPKEINHIIKNKDLGKLAVAVIDTYTFRRVDRGILKTDYYERIK